MDAQQLYEQSREKHYLDIEPCIMVERLLLDGEQVPNDIKFHCFNDNHEIRMFIQVDYQRFGTHRRDIFDIDWNRTEIRISLPNADEPMPRPTRLDEMTRLARQAAQQFSYVRVDFYQVGEKVYFGELTFTPGAGLSKLMPKTLSRNGAVILLSKHLCKESPPIFKCMPTPVIISRGI